MIRLAVAGAAGRMGKTILALAKEDSLFKVVGAVEHDNSPMLGHDVGIVTQGEPWGVLITNDAELATEHADVLIDFTHASSTPYLLKTVLANKVGYVLGTTGLSDKVLKSLKNASRKIPIVQSPNMSVGVNLLFRIAEIASKALDDRYDVEIFEAHHRMKKDAPSGTAMKLLEIIAKARGVSATKDSIYGRVGETGARKAGKIGMLAARGGDVIGDHTVYYYGDGERIELTHRASSRNAFAKGSLVAAKFIAKRKNGLYNMQQVLGIA